MKPAKLSIDTSILEVSEYLKSSDSNELIIVDCNGELAGRLSKDTVKKALFHKLEKYSSGLITEYIESQPQSLKPFIENVSRNRISQILPSIVNAAINDVSTLAGKQSINAFLVGGPARDIIRGTPSLDIDINMETNAIDLAEILAGQISCVTIKEKHPPFGTAKLSYQKNQSYLNVDLASTRKEFYPSPGALPIIQSYYCPIAEDLIRRDFTINAMAISISPSTFGKLIDVTGGYSDIQNKTLRILHSYSFIDDPTRIIRGIKFAVRFGYHFSPATERLLKECIESGLFDGYCSERLKLEIKSALNLNRVEIVDMIREYNIYRLLDTSINSEDIDQKYFKTLNNNLNHFSNEIDSSDIWLCYLALLLQNMPDNRLFHVLNELYLTNREKEAITGGLFLLRRTKTLNFPLKPSEIYNLYHNHQPASIILSASLTGEVQLIENIENYFQHYSQTKIYTTGQKLIELGLTPGPQFSEILQDIQNKKLDQLINSEEDELTYIQKHYL